MSKTPPALEDVRRRTSVIGFDDLLCGLFQLGDCSVMPPHWLNGLLHLSLADLAGAPPVISGTEARLSSLAI